MPDAGSAEGEGAVLNGCWQATVQTGEVATANSPWELTVGASSKGKARHHKRSAPWLPLHSREVWASISRH